MGIGGYLSKDSHQDDNQVKALRLGFELGMTFIDTAEVYGNGHSEELVGRAIEGIRDKVFIASKVSPEHLFYDDLLLSAEKSLRKLKTDYIDLYQVHWPNPKVPIDETMRAMEQLVRNGKVRYVGMSNFSLRQFKAAQAVLSENEIVSVQVEYNLFDRNIENSILPYCESESIITIAYSPLDQGQIAGDYKKTKALEMIANRYNRTVAQVALNWLISHPSVIAIPKATNPIHIRDNASAADFELSDEDFEEISRVFTQKYIYAPTDRIRVIVGNRQVYQTVDEALENKLSFVPSPLDLAQDIRKDEILKPIKVTQSTDESGKYDYDLIEGRIRYWAWVIAHQGKKTIPVYVCEEQKVNA
ncbi:MAG: aldo/keto reductase [Planctomycetes bacterium]|nr:aldo/keto reductase [Planctomycetota bacterium]